MTPQLVTSVRWKTFGAHDVVKIWVRGGYAGELVVDEGDGEVLARRLASAVCTPSTEDGWTVWEFKETP